MRTKHTALTAIALALVAGFALAQPGPGCPMGQCGAMLMGEKPDQPAMPAMSPEQLDKMDGLRMSHLKEVMPLQTDLRIREMELGALWRAEKLDAKKIVAKVKEISDLRARLQLTRVNHQLAMYEIMTPEQRKAWHPGMMGPRGMRGMMRGPGMGRGKRVMKRIMLKGDADDDCPAMGCDPENCPECGMQ